MNVTFEINSQSELEKLFSLFKSFQFENVKVVSTPQINHALITKGDKSINPKSLFGIWKDKPRSLEEIRGQIKIGTMQNLADLRLDLSEVFKQILF